MKIEKLNRSEAFRYMGYKGGEIKDEIIKITEECEQRLLDAIKPKYVYRVFDIEESDQGVLVKDTPLIFKGNAISKHLKDCDRCVLMCATLSAEADKVIRSYEAVEMEKAVIADSLASAAAEQVCELAEAEIQKEVGSFYYTWRFSPGYGDFPLDIQKDFLSAVDAAKRIGVTVTQNDILIPRKSVTAVMGISQKEISKTRRGCNSCNMKDTCKYRKAGSHCGF